MSTVKISKKELNQELRNYNKEHYSLSGAIRAIDYSNKDVAKKMKRSGLKKALITPALVRENWLTANSKNRIENGQLARMGKKLNDDGTKEDVVRIKTRFTVSDILQCVDAVYLSK